MLLLPLFSNIVSMT